MVAAIIQVKQRKSSKGHGGARAGAGKPPAAVDMQRVLKLREEGYSMAAIARKLEVKVDVIKRRIKKENT